MNLKRLRGIATVALITIAAALFAGCSNSMAGSVESGSNARMATLSLSATGIPNDYAEQFAKSYPTAAKAAARSITPNDPYEITDDGTLTFKLSGKSETGKVLADTQVYLKATTDTTVVDGKTVIIYNFYSDNSTPPSAVTLDAMSWNLKLVAYDGSKAVLQGFCSVDLRTGSGTAKFTMGTEGLDTEGSVKITGTFVDTDDAAKSFSMGIYRKDTGVELLTVQKKDCADLTDPNEFKFEQTGVAPGTYLYTMIFYASAGCTGNIVGSFTDTLVVDPGNDLERTLHIDVIGKKPEKPGDLKAYLVNGSEGKDGSPTYNVKVEWTKSKYATNYELQVLEYKGDDTDGSFAPAYDTDTDEPDDTTKNNWNVTTYGMRSMDPETDNTKAVKDFAGSAVYGTAAGTSYIMFGDTSCSLVFETGKIYEIRLRGRNYIGVSKYAERATSTNDADHSVTDFTGFAVATDNKDHINRMLITYHLDGGTLEDKQGEAGVLYKNLYTQYKSWNPTFANTTTNTALPTDDGTVYEIKNGDSHLTSWLFEKGEGLRGDGSVINSADADVSKNVVTNFTYKNLTVIASYGNKVTGNISMGAALEDLDLSKIKVYLNGSATAEAPEVLTETGNTVTLNKYTIQKLAADGTTSNKVSIVLDGDDATDKYKDVSFMLIDAQNKQKSLPIDNGKKRTCTIDLANYPTGNIQVMVSAVTNKMTTVSQTLLFELQ